MSKLRKLASHTVLYGLTYFGGRLLNFLLTPLYTRILPKDEYGSMSLIYAYITFFNILYTYGMETGYFYFTNKQKGGRELIAGTSFLSVLYSSLFFSAILLVFTPFFAYQMECQNHPEYVRYAALILMFDAMTAIPFAALRRADRAVRFATLKFANIVLNIIFNWLFFFAIPYIMTHESLSFLRPVVAFVYDPAKGVGYILLANVISSLITLLWLLPETLKMKLSFNKTIWRNMLIYSWPLLILGFAGMINETLDRILLSRRLPGETEVRMAQVGIYSACYKISIFMTLAIASFRYAAEPFFFAQMKELGAKELFARILKYFSFVTSFIFLGIMLYLPLFMKVIGPNFREGIHVVPILLLANLFLGIFYYLSQWYKQTNRNLYGAYVAIGGAVITLVINYLFIPGYGYMASAWATFVCYFAMAVSSYILGQKYYPVQYETKRIAFYIGLAIGLYWLSNILSSKPLGELSLLMYFINSLFMIGYVLTFIYIEKPFFLKRVPVLKRLIAKN